MKMAARTEIIAQDGNLRLVSLDRQWIVQKRLGNVWHSKIFALSRHGLLARVRPVGAPVPAYYVAISDLLFRAVSDLPERWSDTTGEIHAVNRSQVSTPSENRQRSKYTPYSRCPSKSAPLSRKENRHG